MNVEIQEKFDPYMFSIRMWAVPIYPLWGPMGMSLVAYSIIYSPTILVGFFVKNALC